MNVYLIPLEVLALLLAGVYYLWVHTDLAKTHTEPLLVGAVTLLIVSLVALVYQALRVRVRASEIAVSFAVRRHQYSRELFEELYRNSPVPYILVDKDGVIESTNYAAIRLFGIEEGAFDGENVFERISGEDSDHIATYPGKLRGGVFINHEEVEIERLDGSKRWVLLSLFSFTDQRKDRKGLLTLVDITKQKEIDKAKTEFVSLASHQLRTPLAAMRWNIDLVRMQNFEGVNEKVVQYLDKVERNILRMDTLVNDFLNASKFELGTLTAEAETIELPAFIEDVYEEQRNDAETKKLKVELSVHTDRVSSDPRLLRMIVGNLLSNAIKYTHAGGSVHLVAKSEKGLFSITVTDTGMGIPADEQDKIFTKIFRASNARSSVPDGTGLGLYVVKEAAKVLGGEITFASTLGEGTTFSVSIPQESE